MSVSKSLTKPIFTHTCINYQSTVYKKIGIENVYYSIIMQKLKMSLIIDKRFARQ